MPATRPTECLAGDDALARGAWLEAREAFEKALDTHELPEALEGLGIAAWWLDLADLVFDSRERAYRLYLARGDRAHAARVAVWLAWDSWAFRGESAVANGWLQRARRLLEGLPSCSERAWLEVREGSLCLLEHGDPVRALALAEESIRIAREVGNIDLEMLGRAVQGLSLVASGIVAEGMSNLDEVNAAVIAGELTDPVAIGLAGCYLIAACERVRDYERAAQWCRRLKEFCAKWGLHPLFAVCRTQYASICLWRGIWLEAEQELCAASSELAASRPAMTGDALVRLAELRRRQGRLAEATALVDQVPPRGAGLLERAELAFDCGDYRAASERAEQYLRHVPKSNCTDRASGLEILLRALAALEDWERAKHALVELSGIAAQVATFPLRAADSFASGCVAMGEDKPDAARRFFEDAVDLYLRSGAPFEVGRARIELARALGKVGQIDAALEEARRAIILLSELKAELESARAQSVLDALSTLQPADRTAESLKSKSGQLSKRELEVLRLVAEGLNNRAIAERLFLSDHTVHRHLTNILDKLDVSTRAAAVAQAARRGLPI
ncbi:MAG TPA: LuxR C-terminal-related transcriptional regulator [Terracidiphilus sp.]|jgi:DNA-binding NarL/FixJ family response regulator